MSKVMPTIGDTQIQILRYVQPPLDGPGSTSVVNWEGIIGAIWKKGIKGYGADSIIQWILIPALLDMKTIPVEYDPNADDWTVGFEGTVHDDTFTLTFTPVNYDGVDIDPTTATEPEPAAKSGLTKGNMYETPADDTAASTDEPETDE